MIDRLLIVAIKKLAIGVLIFAAFETAFVGWLGLMYCWAFGRLFRLTDVTFREWTRFWFNLEYLG